MGLSELPRRPGSNGRCPDNRKEEAELRWRNFCRDWSGRHVPRDPHSFREPEEAGRLSPMPRGGVWSCRHLGYEFMASRTVEEHIFIVSTNNVIMIYYNSLRNEDSNRPLPGGSVMRSPGELDARSRLRTGLGQLPQCPH